MPEATPTTTEIDGPLKPRGLATRRCTSQLLTETSPPDETETFPMANFGRHGDVMRCWTLKKPYVKFIHE